MRDPSLEQERTRERIAMNHTEALEQQAVERYLLDEMNSDAREAFEEHLFDCQQCALDLRAGTLFVDEVKVQLPAMLNQPAAERKTLPKKPSFWEALLRPALVAPAFAALLAVVVFQNAVTFPTLRDAASQPRLMPLTHLRPPTRGGSHATLTADRAHGAALEVDLPTGSGLPAAASYSIDLHDAQGKSIWTTTMAANPTSSDQDQQLSLFLPGAKLANGTYTLNIAGIDAQGGHTSAAAYVFDIVVTN